MVYKSGCVDFSNGDRALSGNLPGWCALALGGCGKPEARPGNEQTGANGALDTQRLSLAGSFRFNAAYAPYVNGNLLDACTSEALIRSMK